MTGPAPGPRGPVPLRPVPDARRLSDVDAITSDALLARGDPGLRWLGEQLPRRALVGPRAGLPAAPADTADIGARVARHRGVDLTALAGTGDGLRRVAQDVRGRHRALAEEAGVLWDSWAGPAADGVADGVVDVARAAHGVVDVLEEIASRVEDAGVLVTDAVGELALALGALADPPAPDDPPAPVPADVDAVLAAGPERTTASDVAVLRAWAAALDARLHRLLALLDRTDAVVAQAWADLAADVERLWTRPPIDPASSAEAEAAQALLAELVAPMPVAVPDPDPGRGPSGLRSPR